MVLNACGVYTTANAHIHAILTTLNAVPGRQVYAWSMLQNGFADILTFEQWAQLWDHLVCARASACGCSLLASLTLITLFFCAIAEM